MKYIKKIACLLIVLNLIQCKGQTEKGVNFPKQKIMTTEKLNIEKYNKIIEQKREKGQYDLLVETLPDNSVIEYSGKDQYWIYSTVTTPLKPAITGIYKDYYKNGILKQESELFMGLALNADEIKLGTSKFYDETGRLIKTIDESVKYENIKVKPLVLFEILKKEPIFVGFTKEERTHFKEIFQIAEKEEEIIPPLVHKALKQEVILNPMDRENVKNVFLTLSKDEKTWNVIKDIYPFGRVELNIDTNSGKIINRKYLKETRP